LIVIINNYDSFTYNLFQYVGKFYNHISVINNDDSKLQDLNISNVKAFIFSPGPGKPNDTGFMPEIISKHYSNIPMLGICLGHQAIVESFGGEVINSNEVCHGKVHQIRHLSNSNIFNNINVEFFATRYHSLIVNKENFPNNLNVTAVTCKNEQIMAIQHKKYKVFGLQFHPESIETIDGLKMIENFIEVIY